MSRIHRFPLAFFLVLALVLPVAIAFGQTGGKLNEEKQRAEEQKDEIGKLTAQEKELSENIRVIEKRIKPLQRQIDAQQEKLNQIRAKEEQTAREHGKLEKRKEKTLVELDKLLRTLWPVHIQKMRNRFQGLKSWDMADRRFTWLTEVYESTNRMFKQAAKDSALLEENLKTQRILAAEAEEQLSRINLSKDGMLKEKLSLRAAYNKVHRTRLDKEAELKEILKTIQSLNYQIKTQKSKKFADHKKGLPWPVQGSVVKGFSPEADPPRRGISISAPENSQVKSVFWGKVVHNDTLRGFGRVVIVYHGNNYYSLYAFLADTYVRMGQDVEKDEPVGTTGFYPEVDGPGLYFELRFRQKAINPKQWLTGKS